MAARMNLEDLQQFYDALAEQAQEQPNGTLRYEGHTYKLFATLEPKRPQPYYSKLRRYLIAMGCVVQEKRGAKNALSVWILHARPDSDRLAQVDRSTVLSPDATEAVARAAVSRQQLRDITERIGGIDVKEVLLDFEQRIARLEATIKQKQEIS